MVSGGKIRVFVSSTIRDMSDLRSALKFWLQELGFEVELSEFNDFERRPDSGTFDACFEAIGQCDFYVLFVGSRCGSEYQNGVSVTRQEFRTAKSLASEGRLTIVPFIREKVHDALRLRDNRAAAKLLYGGSTDEAL